MNSSYSRLTAKPVTRPPLAVIVLAAGQGKRMISSFSKVLQLVGGEPMIRHVIATAESLNPQKIVVIVGIGKDQVIKTLEDKNVVFIEQKERLGTGHAVLQTRDVFSGFTGNILILSGDVPLISQNTLDKLLNKHYVTGTKASVLTVFFEDPTGYGRIIKNGNGSLEKIVEERDCTDELRAIQEVNSGTYVFDSTFLFRYLPSVGCNNAQKEFYLTDVISKIKEAGGIVSVKFILDSREAAGVNTPEQLEEVNRFYQKLHETD